MSRRIIVARLPVVGHWSAWFQDTPGHGFGGQTPSQALVRLAETLPDGAIAIGGRVRPRSGGTLFRDSRFFDEFMDFDGFEEAGYTSGFETERES